MKNLFIYLFQLSYFLSLRTDASSQPGSHITLSRFPLLSKRIAGVLAMQPCCGVALRVQRLDCVVVFALLVNELVDEEGVEPPTVRL